MSELSDFRQYHIGCVAVYKHKIISSGCNSNRTNPKQKSLNKYRFDCDTRHTIHAELDCLLSLISRRDIDFKNVELYIYREHKNGELALARPCAGCQALIKELGIRSIYYTNAGGYSHEIFY
jgi:deoxycytidylate deaminase